MAISRNSLMPRVKLAQADAVTFDGRFVFGQEKYDRIYFSYTLSMIPDWERAIQTASNHLSHAFSGAGYKFGCQDFKSLLGILCVKSSQRKPKMFHSQPCIVATLGMR